ncbi:MAG: DUF368 domain-containing protein [Halioglobus sp.]
MRGLLMGAADIVPGVSGGTVAFITGIYDTLLGSIRAFDVTCVKLVFRGELRAAWEHVNGNFLLFLLLGIATSIISLARVISWVLETHPVPLWAFFFGLIFASALALVRHVAVWNLPRVFALVAGLGIAVGIGLSPAASLGDGFTSVFLAGFLAICAMILPGISGSFILVLLGMYSTVLSALKGFDIVFILVFACGAAAGLMSFSRLLHWLLDRFHAATMALLTGFLGGSLLVVWPWKEVLTTTIDRHGDVKPVQQVPVLPTQFESITGQDPQILLCLALMAFGFAAVWLIDRRWGQTHLDS